MEVVKTVVHKSGRRSHGLLISTRAVILPLGQIARVDAAYPFAVRRAVRRISLFLFLVSPLFHSPLVSGPLARPPAPRAIAIEWAMTYGRPFGRDLVPDWEK